MSIVFNLLVTDLVNKLYERHKDLNIKKIQLR